MNKQIALFLLGAVAGALILGLIIQGGVGDRMLMEDRSRLGFEETVDAIREAALAAGWKVPIVHRLHESVAEGGHEVRPAAVVELCQVDLAARILGDEKGRRVAPLMPCRIAVYEDPDGGVVVSRLDSALMSRLFGGVVAETMSEAAGRNEAILAPVLAR